MDNSDYKELKTDLYDLLPEVFKSSVNKSVFNNVFNRYLTKPELTHIDGIIGVGNPNAIINKQVPELTPNRQAYQLQPILHSQVGTIDHMATYVDILNEVSRMGVDTNRLKKWGNTQQFNWVPPINIDKLLRFRDYFWYDPEKLNSQPQYITIRDLCQDAKARVDGYQLTLDQYGEDHTIQLIDQVNKTFSIFGDLSDVFVIDFVFFIQDSLNSTINNRYWTAVSSTYNSATNLTTITVKETIGDGSIVSGLISLTETLDVLSSARDCACSGSFGWDGAQWDDNQGIGNIIWNDDLMQDYSMGGILSSTDPSLSGSPVYTIVEGDFWFDTTNDQLKRYNGTSWDIIRNSFQTIVDETSGRHLWDLSRGCTIPTNQWVEQNKWIHKSHIANPSVAKQAQIPIIEFNPHIELNVWNVVEHNWKYRETKLDAFVATTTKPTMFELQDIPVSAVVTNPTNEFSMDSNHGDLTNIFIPGYVFEVLGSTGNDGVYTVKYSLFQKEGPLSSDRYRTVIRVNENIPDSTVDGKFVPTATSQGDPWKALHEHWLYDTMTSPVAIDHQPENPFVSINVDDTAPIKLEIVGNESLNRYQYEEQLYSQKYTIDVVGGMDAFPLQLGLHDVSMVDTNDIRVYVNDIRQYGSYIEGLTISGIDDINKGFIIDGDVSTSPRFVVAEKFNVINSNGLDGTYTVVALSPGSPSSATSYDAITNKTTIYVDESIAAGLPVSYGYIKTPYIIGVSFLVNVERFNVVRIEVGAIAAEDIGRERIDVRTIEDETGWIAGGTTEKTLIRYRKSEQVKSAQNQYPLFNIFEVNGVGTNKAKRIFEYKESSENSVNPFIGKRIVEIEAGRNYEFEQSLIEQDNDKMFAYRDYSRLELVDDTDVRYWVNTDTNIVKIWDGKTWDVRVLTDNHHIKPKVSLTDPGDPWTTIDGMLWYDSMNNQLKKRDTTTSQWDVISAYIQNVDETMQTIWRGGLNKEQYIPEYVDKDRSPITIGNTNGDWEIPNQLYFNYSHENKKNITLVELLAHFSSIITAQEKPAGFSGSTEQLFHLIENVNYGVGGRIKEYNNSYDTFLSSTFVDNVTPPALIEFAQDQYDNALNTLIEFFRQDAVAHLTNTTQSYLLDIGVASANSVITQYEVNDNNALIYGDGITYNADTGKGVKNWIATLPFFKLTNKSKPELLIDNTRNIVEVIHHDGHRSQPMFQIAVIEQIINQVITTAEVRTGAGNTVGLRSTTTPPNTMNEIVSMFNATLPQTGKYWYHVQGNTRDLYRLSIVSALTTEPSSTVEDGALWYDDGTNTLRMKSGTTWNPVTSVGDDIITSAWKKININEIIATIIFEVESRLYDAVPDFNELVFDYNLLTPDSSEQAVNDLYFEEAFSQYISERKILSPFSNQRLYVLSDAFTWNYKNSIIANYPTSSNLGTESGGVYQDIYEKLYGTPYPHLEPWKLQGYNDKPSWWNDQYKQTDGSRRWVYIHNNLAVDSYDETNEYVMLNGDWTKLFPAGTTFNISGSTSNDGTWTIFNVSYNITTNKTTIRVVEDISVSNTPGIITGPLGMWENIRVGLIPSGEALPNGAISTGTTGAVTTYSFLSVNVDDTITTDNLYSPDDLLPPFWDHKSQYGSLYTGMVRSLYNSLAEVINPSFDYLFQDIGLEEWKWRVSSQYLYDNVRVAFRMQPVRLMHSAFGTEFYDVADLQIDKRTGKVYSHNDTIFHGDIVDGTIGIKINGINQWYVNHGRFSGYDISFSDFRRLWTNWVAPLGYQFASFVDTTGVEIINKNFDINKKDYTILMKRSPGISDFWVDSFDVTLTHIPPSRISYNTESDWKFEFKTASPGGNPITVLGVHNYEFTFKSGTNQGTLYRYNIEEIDAINDTISISGNKTELLSVDGQITVVDAGTNNGSYTVRSATYDSSTDITIIDITSDLPNPAPGGAVIITHRNIPWQTGDEVYLSSTRVLPIELDDVTKYYIIKDSNTTFRLADTLADANFGNALDITNIGIGIHFIGQLKSTFNVLDGSDVWRHYEIDPTFTRTLIPPFNVQGIQESVDIIDGYVDYAESQGFKFNDNSLTEIDGSTGRSVSWQLEIERFIDWATAIRSTKYQEPDFYSIVADYTTNAISFTNQTPVWGTGTKVTLSLFDGSMPTPLLRNIPYYIIRSSATDFKLATTALKADEGVAIDLLGNESGELLIQEYINREVFSKHEINPFRNNLWVNHKQGVIANIIHGPYKDVRSEQTIYDQYGRSISLDDLIILREDIISQISIQPGIVNDKITSFITVPDEYTYLHIGGAHIFLDGYEHVVLFNDYSTEDALIYDPFLGLNTDKFNVRYERQREFTLRPNVGGYALRGKQLMKNFETSVVDMQNYYDTFTLNETSDVALYSRKLLGFDRSNIYLDQININPKSKFIFWRGMIQSKGSINSVNAFINSRRFIDAKVDEYWAYKLAEFGDAREKEYLSLNLFTNDSLTTELKIEFMRNILDTPQIDFIGVHLNDTTRWYEQPLQKQKLIDNTEMYMDAEITTADDTPTITSI